jgi:hypothetical protein
MFLCCFKGPLLFKLQNTGFSVLGWKGGICFEIAHAAKNSVARSPLAVFLLFFDVKLRRQIVLKRSCPCTYTHPTFSPLVTTGSVSLCPCIKQGTYEEKKWLYSNLVAIRLISLQMQSRQRITSGLCRDRVPKGTDLLVASHIKTDAPFCFKC